MSIQPQPERSIPESSTALEIALQWSQLPPEHLEIALRAMEPQLARDHDLKMEKLRLAAENKREARTQTLYIAGLAAGFVIVVGMLGSAVIVGINGQPWLAAMLAGPSVISLAGLFVLRRVDSTAARGAARTTRSALNAVYQPSGPAPTPVAAPPDPGASSGPVQP
jgi:hypothetical protein